MHLPIVLVAGEDSNDTTSLVHLIRALLPDEVQYIARSLRRPPILRRNAALAKRRSMAIEVAGLAAPFLRTHAKVITVAHRDCDAIEPAHLQEALSLESDLRQAGAPNPIAATPAWEMETWWMLFPDALRATRSCWTVVDYSTLDVGMIEHAKERLTRDLRPKDKRKKCHDYKESDSVTIAQNISVLRLAKNEISLKSNSLKEFKAKVLNAFNE